MKAPFCLHPVRGSQQEARTPCSGADARNVACGGSDPPGLCGISNPSLRACPHGSCCPRGSARPTSGLAEGCPDAAGESRVGTWPGGCLQDASTLQAVGKATCRTTDSVWPGKQRPGLRRAHGAWAVWARRENPAQAQQTGGLVLRARWPGRSSGARDASPSPLTSAGAGPWAQEAPLQVDQARLSPGKGPRQTSPRRETGLSSVRRLQQRRLATCLHSKEVT